MSTALFHCVRHHTQTAAGTKGLLRAVLACPKFGSLLPFLCGVLAILGVHKAPGDQQHAFGIMCVTTSAEREKERGREGEKAEFF